MSNFFNQDDEVTFDMEPNEGEEEYRIVGANFRKLTPSDTGESESFWIIAETNNPRDRYAVRVENNHRKHVGYLSKEDNRFWHELLLKCCGGRTPAMKCRGFVGRFYNDEEELSYYGKVFLPKLNEEERAEAVAMGRKEVDELRQQVKNSETVEKEMGPKFILALCIIFIIIFIWCLF